MAQKLMRYIFSNMVITLHDKKFYLIRVMIFVSWRERYAVLRSS